jgi:hypothetical protein
MQHWRIYIAQRTSRKVVLDFLIGFGFIDAPKATNSDDNAFSGSRIMPGPFWHFVGGSQIDYYESFLRRFFLSQSRPGNNYLPT